MEPAVSPVKVRPSFSTIAACAALIVAATIPARAVFLGWGWTLPVWGAAIGGAVAASLIETLREKAELWFLSVAATLGALLWALGIGLRSSFWATPASADVWADLRDGIFNGWGALLEEQFPLTDPVSAEIFLSMLVWLAAAAGIHVAARRGTALGTIAGGSVVLFVTTAAGLSQGLASAFFGAAAGVAALFLISTITRAPEQRWRPGRILALAAVIAAAGAVAAAAGGASESVLREPLDPRASQTTEIVDFEVPDLLAEYGVRRDLEQTDLVIGTPAFPASLRLRLQAYEVHTGERWLPTAEFTEIATFPEPPQLPPGEVVDLEVTIDGLDGPWIPLPDRLISTDLNDLRYSEATQTALMVSPPTTYAVTGSLVGEAGLESLGAATDDIPEFLSEAPGLPDTLRAEAEQVTASASTTLETINALKARLRQLGRNESVPAGHSYGRLRDDLLNNRATGAEQIATLHALMLRSLGIPSRLAVGYVSSDPIIEAAELTVWVEVPFEGIGWVAIDTVPALTDTETADEDGSVAPTTTLADGSALRARALPRELGPGEDPDQDEIGADDEFGTLDALLFLLGLVVALLALLAVLRQVRRRIRRSTARRASVRVLGAWAEGVDRLRELGAPVRNTTTIGDVVEMATEMDDDVGEQMRHLSEFAAAALHGPHNSEPTDAEEAWAQLSEVERAIAAAKGRHSAALRFVDPRVLRYRSPKPPATRDGGHRTPVTTP